jgi:hypothetical protein
MNYYRYDDPMWYEGEYEPYELLLNEYKVLKITPRGVWIKYPRNDKYPVGKYIEGKKFILEKIGYFNKEKTKKRFAWPTKEEALISYKKRKEGQIWIIENQLRIAKLNLELAKGINNA